MVIPVLMPKLGMTMEEGTVVSWAVEPGERVEKGRLLLVIESEKTEADVEATVSGFLRHVYVGPGETVPCGTLLAALTETTEERLDIEGFAALHPAPTAAARATGASGDPGIPASRPAPSGGRSANSLARPPRRAVAPAARALAGRLGVDLDRVAGSGPGGRVVRQDVEAFAARRDRLRPVSEGVALEVLGEGEGPPLLLLPGFGTDVSSLAPQARCLAARCQVLGVNPRGVGLSDAPDEPAYTVGRAAADAAALVGEPAHLVGASLGAAVALELAWSRPELVRSLVLITPFVEASARLLAVTAAWCRMAAEVTSETLAQALLPWLFSERFLAEDETRARTVRGLAATLARVPAPTLPRAAAGLQAWSGTRREELGRVSVPTLVLAAGADLLTPGSEEIGRAIPRARTIVVPEAGHALAIEASELVNEALRAHLDTWSG